jgi:hypothetical protein
LLAGSDLIWVLILGYTIAMAKVVVSNSFPSQPILRQIPKREAKWCRHEFVLDPGDGEDLGQADAWIVYDDLMQPTTCVCDRNRTMLVTGEPPSVRRYRKPFTSQFGWVRTSHQDVQHQRVQLGHEAQPWHYGLQKCRSHPQTLDYDALTDLSPPTKGKLISVIASNKDITEDHRQRLRLVEQLKVAFGDSLDVFGRGIRDIPDKADAIWDYKYHIVLENDHSPYYMSEKLPDGFLGWSFPIYSGSQLANQHFPTHSFGRIDMYDIPHSIAAIKTYIESRAYELHLESIALARTIVLNQLNLFAVLCNRMDSWEQRSRERTRKATPLTLFPKKRSLRLTYGRWLRAIAMSA